MEGESKLSVALAFDAAGQAEAEARRVEAGASVVGSGSLAATPVEEAMVSSVDLVRWSGQLGGEVRKAESKVD